MNERLVIVDGLRTPFCKAGSDLASLAADELGRIAVSALLTRTGLDPALIDEVIIGCVGQPPESANVARVIALRAGIPESVPAVTVHRNCASGFESFTTAYERMAAGRGSIYVVGGAESMSQRADALIRNPLRGNLRRLAKAKTTSKKLAALTAFRLADFEPRAGLKLGLTDPVCGIEHGRDGGIARAGERHHARSAGRLCHGIPSQSHRRRVPARRRKSRPSFWEERRL